MKRVSKGINGFIKDKVYYIEEHKHNLRDFYTKKESNQRVIDHWQANLKKLESGEALRYSEMDDTKCDWCKIYHNYYIHSCGECPLNVIGKKCDGSLNSPWGRVMRKFGNLQIEAVIEFIKIIKGGNK